MILGGSFGDPGVELDVGPIQLGYSMILRDNRVGRWQNFMWVLVCWYNKHSKHTDFQHCHYNYISFLDHLQWSHSKGIFSKQIFIDVGEELLKRVRWHTELKNEHTSGFAFESVHKT